MLSSLKISDEAIDYALGMMSDFIAVYNGGNASSEERQEKVEVLCESLGMQPAHTLRLFEGLFTEWKELAPFIFVGTIIGLRMAEYAVEHSDEEA